MTSQPGASENSGLRHRSGHVWDRLRASFWSHLHRAAVSISLILFVVACGLPVLDIQVEGLLQPTRMSGLVAVLSGWLGPFEAIWDWYANLLLFVSMIMLLLRKWFNATLLTLPALVLASATPSWAGRYVMTGMDLFGGPAGFTIVSVTPGYYVWLASIAVVGIAGVIGLVKHRRRSIPRE